MLASIHDFPRQDRAGIRPPRRAGGRSSRRRARRNAQARGADGADAARADRDDDDRSRLHRTARRERVAAASLAHTVFFVSFTFGMGLVSAVAPLAAQAFGARDPRMVRSALRVGLWAALLISLPLMALPLRGEQILLALGQAPMAARLAQQYLFGLAWGIAAGAVVHCDPRLHERGQPAGADRSGSRLRRSRPMRCWSISLLYGAWGLPRARAVRRGPCDHASSISAPSLRGCGSPTTAGRSGSITCSATSGGSTGT